MGQLLGGVQGKYGKQVNSVTVKAGIITIRLL
jgi:hypothetical protein